MDVKTGITALDNVLHGGIPENRTVLLTGGPGAGKSTLAMQFLQKGLDDGEDCLYISTEQTPTEIRDSFEPYEFDSRHDRLTITTIHATPGHTIEGGNETELTIETLEGDESVGSGFSAPFNNTYIEQVLEKHAPCDRVVFDSVSGLAAMTDDRHTFRRAILDMIRLFSDEFEATSIFTAEERDSTNSNGGIASSDALQFNTHGVIRLWRESVDGDQHRFLRVLKMRGVKHDTRQYELEFGRDGVRMTPQNRTRPQQFMQQEFLETGVPGLDQLSGGFIQGSTALLEHDGRADVDPMIIAMITEAIERGETIVLFPSANMDPERLDSMLPSTIAPVEELLARNQLFVLDFVGTWDAMDGNTFSFGQGDGLLGSVVSSIKLLRLYQIKQATEQINDNRGDSSAFAVLHTESLLQHLEPEEVRQMYYWAKENLLRTDDRVLFVQNPGVMDDTLAEFYSYDAEQILRTWLNDGGLQYVKLEKSPIGRLGGTKLVRYTDTCPYVEVQQSSRKWRTERETERTEDTEPNKPSVI